MSWFTSAVAKVVQFVTRTATRISIDPRPKAIATQFATRDASHPLKKIALVSEIALLFKRIKYKEDPLNGRLDYVPHPTAFQRGIDLGTVENPYADDDCDGYAIFCAAVLLKSQLADVVWYATASYTYVDGPRKGEQAGHAVCVYRDKTTNKHHWIGNWHGGVPMDLPSPEGWVEALERYGMPADAPADAQRPRRANQAQRSFCVLQSDDTVVFANMVMDRG